MTRKHYLGGTYMGDFISWLAEVLTFIMVAALLCVNLFTVSAVVMTVFRVLFVVWCIAGAIEVIGS